MALVAAMRPKSCGSSTIGMKKSVVAMTQVPLSSCQTAASSPVSSPTSSCLYGVADGWLDSNCCSTDGASLHPHPPPWERWLRRICCWMFIDGLSLTRVRVSAHIDHGQRIGAFHDERAAKRHVAKRVPRLHGW